LEAAKRPVGPYHSVAWYDNWNGILSESGADSACGVRFAQFVCDPSVGACLTPGYGTARGPYFTLKGGCGSEIERHAGERCRCSVEVCSEKVNGFADEGWCLQVIEAPGDIWLLKG
jgi:hypothetical protein